MKFRSWTKLQIDDWLMLVVAVSITKFRFMHVLTF